MAAYTIENPLVAMIIIGDYENSNLPSIKTANKDYQNVIHAFNFVREYTVVFAQNSDDANCKINIQTLTSSDPFNKRENVVKSDNFKSTWTYDDIEEFNETIKNEFIDSDESTFDSLIYVISSHGSGKTIYDSIGESYELSFVYNEFDNENCKQLRNKPKIYLCDTNRINISNDIDNKINHQTKTMKSKTLHTTNHAFHTKQRSTGNDNSDCDVVTKTYTKETHFHKIFGHSAQQRISNETRDWVNKFIQNGSLFIQCFTAIFEKSTTASNDQINNLRDILFETRKFMATILRLPDHSADAVMLHDDSTMPYDVAFDFFENKNDGAMKFHQNANGTLAAIDEETVCLFCVFYMQPMPVRYIYLSLL